jgi:hypothetical protein
MKRRTSCRSHSQRVKILQARLATRNLAELGVARRYTQVPGRRSDRSSENLDSLLSKSTRSTCRSPLFLKLTDVFGDHTLFVDGRASRNRFYDETWLKFSFDEEWSGSLPVPHDKFIWFCEFMTRDLNANRSDASTKPTNCHRAFIFSSHNRGYPGS